MTTKELIRREIERRLKWLNTATNDFAEGRRGELRNLYNFIDTLPDEPEQPTMGYDEAYLNEKIAKASKSWEGVDVDNFMDEIRGREPVTDCHDLEEAAENSWVDYEYREDPRGLYSSCYIDGFIAGAEWGAEHLRDATKKISEDLEEVAENSRVPEDAWQTARQATKTLNAMNLGIKFYGNLFPYLRKRGKLPLCCKKKGRVWLYETDEIAWLVKNGKIDYKPR